MSTMIDIADAVVSQLNAASLSVAFTAARVYENTAKLEDLSTISVKVMPGSLTYQNQARKLQRGDYAIEIGVQKKLTDADDNTEVDALVDLMEEIADLLMQERPTDQTAAICVEVVNDPVYSLDTIRTRRAFSSVLIATYREMRTI